MSEKQQPESNLTPPSGGPGARRRRGRRGGRGRRRPTRSAPSAERSPDMPPEASPVETPETEFSEPVEPVEAPQAPIERPEESSIASQKEFKGPAISEAVNEVMQIVEALRQALAQMEDVLELVEVAERQKLGDEREIDSLRRAIRRFHHPRGESHGRSQTEE